MDLPGAPFSEPLPAEVRQPFADFERAAEDLRRIHRTLSDVRKAAAGDRAALVHIRCDFPPYADPDTDVFSGDPSSPVKVGTWRDPP
jgi:hypothetical protein